MTAQQFLSQLNSVKKTANGWQARCPAHDDCKASLSIGEGDKGVVLYCQAGCETKAIVASLGLSLSDLFTTPAKLHSAREIIKNGTQKRHILATYDYTDEAGQLLFQAVRYEPKEFRQRRPDGKGGYLHNLTNTRRVLYRLPELIKADKSAIVFLCEGEKDVEALRAISVVATCNPMGAGKWHDEFNEVLRGRAVVILPDNDKPGIDHAEMAARSLYRIATSVKILRLPNLPDKGDVSDWLANGGGANELMVLAKDAPDWTPETAIAKPQKTAAGGVTFIADEASVKAKDADGNATVVSSPLWIEAITRDEHAANFGRLLRFIDPDGNEKQWAMPASLLSGDKATYEGYLRDQGVDIFNSKHLHTYLASKPESGKRVLVVSRTGWHRGVFVFADECIGRDDGEGIFHQSPEGGNHLLRTAGTLAEWQHEVARYCANNSRLTLAVCAGLAATLLGKLNVEGGGFHLRGGTSTGKTTALLVGGSVWGGGSDKGFLRRWRATINGLESVAASHNDALLCLDELAEVDPFQAGETAYMLANGQGKIRQTKSITLRKPLEWRTLFLSSGEISLADHLATVNKRTRGGMEVRLIDLPADAGKGFGLFEELHSFTTAKELSDHLQDASKRCFGTAARAFISHLVQQSDNDLRDGWQSFKTAFSKMVNPADAKEEAGRVCDRFALVSFAGEMATGAGITGWSEGEATNAASLLFKEWLSHRGTGRSDEDKAIQQVRKFIQENQDARFRKINGNGNGDVRTLQNIAGCREELEDAVVYYISKDVFQTEVCKGYDPTTVAKTLDAQNLLIKNHGYQFKRRDPESKATAPFYAVSSAIFERE